MRSAKHTCCALRFLNQIFQALFDLRTHVLAGGLGDNC